MFENAWLKDSGCRDIIISSWGDSVGLAIPARLVHCGEHLRKWGGDLGRQLNRDIDHAKQELNSLRMHGGVRNLARVRVRR